MGDFNIAQFLGGIVQGMGKGLTSDKGGSDAFAQMEVIPKKKNAPPVIEMTPSQTAATDIVKGAGEAVAMGQPILSPSAPVAPVGGGNVPAWRKGVQVVSEAEFDDTSTDPPKYDWSGAPIKYGHDLPGEGGWSCRGGGMRQMRSGGITEPGEEVIVHENEKVQELPNGQVIVTPEEEVAVDRGMPQPSTPVVREPDRNPERPPNMAIPETVEEGENDVGYLERKLLKDMEVKPSPWKDLGAALIQAGNNHFNNKNEPVRTWGEIQRDKRVAPTAGKLALIKDAKASRQAAEEKAARVGLIGAQTKTIGEDDVRLRDNLNRQIAKDENSEKIAMRRLDQGDVKAAQGWLKLAQTDELMRLRDKWALADDEINKKRVALIEQEVRNRQTRHNENLDFNKQKQGQLQTYRGAALKIAAAKKGSDGSPENEAKIKKAETALDLSLRRAVKSELMSQEEADEIRSEQIRGFLNGGVDPIDE